jgi:hypothetical protein
MNLLTNVVLMIQPETACNHASIILEVFITMYQDYNLIKNCIIMGHLLSILLYYVLNLYKFRFWDHHQGTYIRVQHLKLPKVFTLIDIQQYCT